MPGVVGPTNSTGHDLDYPPPRHSGLGLGKAGRIEETVLMSDGDDGNN